MRAEIRQAIDAARAKAVVTSRKRQTRDERLRRMRQYSREMRAAERSGVAQMPVHPRTVRVPERRAA